MVERGKGWKGMKRKKVVEKMSRSEERVECSEKERREDEKRVGY